MKSLPVLSLVIAVSISSFLSATPPVVSCEKFSEIEELFHPLSMEKEEPANPEYVGFLGPVCVMLNSKRIPDLFEQFFGFGSSFHSNKRAFLRDIM